MPISNRSLWHCPILALVVDREASTLPVADAVQEAVRGGVDWIQIRERDMDGCELLAFSESLARAAAAGVAERTAESGQRVAVIINRRIDIALTLAETGAAQGVQLGFDAVSAAVARELLGTEAWIGLSTHHPDEVARLATHAPGEVSYAQLAPIFSPLSKTSTRSPLGLAALERACGSGVPILAQGGLDSGNARNAIEAGAAGIAVTGAILQSTDPGAEAKRLRRALDGADGASTA